MAVLKSDLQKAFDMVDRRQNDAALKVIDEILSGLEPPNRVEIAPGPAHHLRPSANRPTKPGRGTRNRASQGRPAQRPGAGALSRGSRLVPKLLLGDADFLAKLCFASIGLIGKILTAYTNCVHINYAL